MGKEYVKAVYSHFAYLTYMQSTMWNASLDETHTGIKIARKNINNLTCIKHYTNVRKRRGTEEHFDEGERWERNSLPKIH